MKQTIIPPSDLPSVGAMNHSCVIRRFLALLIDWVIIFTLLCVVMIPLWLLWLLGSVIVSPLIGLIGVGAAPSFVFVFVMSHWIYYATMESGLKGSTYGKRLMGIRVVSDRGQGITFSRASLRYFSKYLSALPFMIGFVMAFFTSRHQALHDLIAETLVIRNP